MKLIDWVDAKCRSWGYAKRRINGIPPQQPKSMAGRIMEEGPVGAAIKPGVPAQPLEVMLGDALTVAISINFAIQAGDVTDRQYEIAYAHYALGGHACRKWRMLGIDRRCYYDTLHVFHTNLGKWIPSIEDRSENLKDVVGL